MSPLPSWFLWSLWFVGWLITAIAAALAAWALFADRSRGRRRCPACWYTLHAAGPLPTCPECGRTPRSERDAHKTRRRWRLALCSLPLLWLGAVARDVEWPIRRGPIGLVPGVVLAGAWPLDAAGWFSGSAKGTAETELNARLYAERLGPIAQRILAARVAFSIDGSPAIPGRHARAFHLSGLAPGGPDPAAHAARCAQNLVSIVDPASWVENGGDAGACKSIGSWLVVAQSRASLDEAARLFDLLREARRRPVVAGRSGPLSVRAYNLRLVCAPGRDISPRLLADCVRAVERSVEPDLWADNGSDGGYILRHGDVLLVVCPEALQPRAESAIREFAAQAP